MKSRVRSIASLYFFGSALFFMVLLSLIGYFLVYREHRLALEKIDELRQEKDAAEIKGTIQRGLLNIY